MLWFSRQKKHIHYRSLNEYPYVAPESIAVWLITGCSSGFGASLCVQLLSRGYQVVATARKPKTLESFAKKYPSQVLTLELDITNGEQRKLVVEESLERFGKIDVLVNNAGISHFTSVEESNTRETRRVMETNFWGTEGMVRELIPSMRKRKHGYIINFSSICGIVPVKGVTYYSASKFAVEAFSEALRDELKSLGITVMIVEPGVFRTPCSSKIDSSSIQLPEYRKIFHDSIDSVDSMHEMHCGRGNPEKGMRLLIDSVEHGCPMPRLLLGSDSLQMATDHYDKVANCFQEWGHLAISTDYSDMSQ